jgi:hypothetical protein
MLARQLVGALDRQRLQDELAPVYATTGAADDVEPAGRDDERVSALGECRWRSLTLHAIGRQAIAVLDSWRLQRQWLDVQPAWMLDPGD